MSHRFTGLLTGALISLAAAAPAAAQVDVTVQIEGQGGRVLAPTATRTPAAAFTKDGDPSHTCAAQSVAGALESAVAGNWTGTYGFGTYTIDSIRGEEHPFGSGSFWAFYVNGRYVNAGACDPIVQPGDEVFLYWADDPFMGGTQGYDEPLRLTGPATARPGQAFTVDVTEATTTFDGAGTGTTTLSPSQGATVAAGSVSATTGADGAASLTLTQRGPVTLRVTKGNRAPDEYTACVTDGADGFCGTTAPDAPPRPATEAPCFTLGDDGRCGTPDRRAAYGFITGIDEQERFARGRGPRQLTGRVDPEPSGIADVRLRLTRNDRGRCWTFDADRSKLVRARRCGASRGRWFEAQPSAEWSYLLPHRLWRGRYVLDVEVVDKAGNRDRTLHRGRNRIVFHVR